MSNNNFKKGITFGSIGVFLIGLQPVIAVARPKILDPFLFAAMTALVEALIFFPLFLIERRNLIQNKNNTFDLQIRDSLLNGWKKKRNMNLLIIISLIFSVIPILLYISFEIAGVINSALTLKTEIIFALVFGVLFLKEKRISKVQIIFCLVLFIGLFLAITQGTFNLLEFNVGVIILTISVALFTFIHTFTKSGFDRNEIFPTQVVFVRNLMSGLLLFILYIIIFPIENLLLILDFKNFIFFILMGFDYGFSLFLWYKTLTYMGIGKASIINSLTPIASAFFAWIILGVSFTMFHLLGILIIIFSIFIIVREEKD